MNDRFDVAVVGTGIVGLGAAYAAVRRGLRVVIVDRAATISGATVRNFGHLCIGAQSGLAREYADLSRAIWLDLAGSAGFWIRESGTLIAAREDDELALLEASAAADLDILSTEELAARAPVRADAVIGGAWIRPDLQTNPREAAAAIAAHLAARGVEFRMRTAVTGVSAGVLATTRGEISADTIVVAVNHDVDQLLPVVAERAGIVRCSLDMIRVRADLARPLDAPLLTGWSLARYGRFARLPEADAVRSRLHRERPDLAALDLNQMYTQLPDGSLIVGDTHVRGLDAEVFQPEDAVGLLLEETSRLLDVTGPLRPIERWIGVYASGRDEFLAEQIEPGVFVLAATTGIGMTCGLGLAEASLSPLLGDADQALPLEPTLQGASS